MDLTELHNPNKITGIMLKNGDYITSAGDQGWQEYPGSVELWQIYEGHLIRVQRWLKKSIIATYK